MGWEGRGGEGRGVLESCAEMLATLSTIEKPLITQEWCMLDKKCSFNTSSDTWLLYLTVTLLPV
jgi:hypothetical protein